MKTTSTSAERMRKMRAKRKEDGMVDEEMMKRKERERIRKHRIEKKKVLVKDQKAMTQEREKEAVRKRKYRIRMKEENEVSTGKGCKNKDRGEALRRKGRRGKNELVDKIKLFENTVRRLKRKNKELSESLDESLPGPSEQSEPETAENSLLSAVSPAGKKRAMQRLKLTEEDETIRKKLRLDKVTVHLKERDMLVRKKVEEFLTRDCNSVAVPDTKVKAGTRYRLASLEMLHLKYLAECEAVSEEISYSHFTRLIPTNITKPKPESWGTCLCMPCINTELKVSAANKIVPCSMDKLDADNIEMVCKGLMAFEKMIEYLEWKSEKKEKGKTEEKTDQEGTSVTRKGATTYHSCKTACSLPSKHFIEAFQEEVKRYIEHIERAKSQYRRIREVKNEAMEQDSVVKLLRIDWSENVELYQTIQEKSQYYHSISASVNTAVLYQSGDVYSLATISDVKSHKAEATLASITSMITSIDLDLKPVKTLYIVSDSPTSQYRNKKVCFLMGKFCEKNEIEVCWIYTETGHGKGPMDGVGSAVKRVVTDTISYHPRSVIRNTEQLLAHLPELNVDISTYTDKDVKKYINEYPKPLRNLKLITDCGFNIGSTHELLITSNKLRIKKLSSDPTYGNLRLTIGKEKKGKKKVIYVEDVKEDKEDSEKEDSEEGKEKKGKKKVLYVEDVKEDEEDSEKEDSEEEFVESLDEEDDELEEVDAPEEEQLAAKAQASLDDNTCGKFYCVYFDNQRYWGKLLKVFADDEDADVDQIEMEFLHYKCNGVWDYPKTGDIQMVMSKYVFLGPVVPLLNHDGFMFKDDKQALRLYNIIKLKNKRRN